MKRILSLVLLVGLSISFGRAHASIVLVTDHPIGTPLVMDAGTVSADQMILSINSDSGDVLLGWQTTLWILPTGGSGSLGFNSTAEPANYVFGARSFYNEDLTFPVTNDGMLAFDADLSLTGAAVPGPPGLNLNALDFIASADASGLFGVFAVGGVGRSEWTNASLGLEPFDNLDPAPDSHTQIGEIFVNARNPIPEPSALLVFGVGLITVGWRLRQARGSAA